MAFFLAALGAVAAAQVGTTIAGTVTADKNAKEGMQHQKETTYLNSAMEIISSKANAPKAIPQ